MTRRERLGRVMFAVTGVVGLTALIIQTLLTVLAIGTRPGVPLDSRVTGFLSYFTIESNILVTVSCLVLAFRPRVAGSAAGLPARGRTAGEGPRWLPAVRAAGVVGITITGVIHLLFLRPLGSPSGIARVADEVFHVVIPVLAVVGWAAFGPRPVRGRVALPALIWPVLYILWTGVHGAVTGWYPYPFADVGLHGYPRTTLIGILILALFALLVAGVRAVDRPERRRSAS